MSFPYIIDGLQALAVPIDTLTSDPDNARLHNRRNLDAIKTSFERYKQVKPIAVRKSDMVVLAGNGRLEVAKELGWTHIAAVIMSGTDEELQAFAVLDNKSSDLAEWDDAALADVLSNIAGVNDELLQGIGFSQAELDNYVDLEDTIEELPDESFTPEPEPKSKSRKQNKDKARKQHKAEESGIPGGVEGPIDGRSDDKGSQLDDLKEGELDAITRAAFTLREEKERPDLTIGECLRILCNRYLKSRVDLNE